MVKKIQVAVIGASGYTGAELVRLLAGHEKVEIAALAADKNAGQPLHHLFPHLAFLDMPPLVKVHEIDWNSIEVAFCCLPHAASQNVIKTLPRHLKIIDLSADFRLYDEAVYAQWYGHAHQAPELQKEAVYGLTEIYREKVKSARLVANPGCYPTCTSLPLIPLLKQEIVEAKDIIIDAKSGISGAGRSEKLANLFCEINETVRPYGICNHRHIPEIEQILTEAKGQGVTVHFTPQIVPMSRGMLASIYVKLSPKKNWQEARDVVAKAYASEHFVKVLPEGVIPATRGVSGTNLCAINIFPGRTPDRAVIISVIDNLLKGASGQAVQNMNLMLGFPETTGLEQISVFP